MTHPSSPPALMTAERYSIVRIRRAQILEPVGAQQFAQHTYASDIRALLEQYDALTARVAELEEKLERVWQEESVALLEDMEKLRTELAVARKVEDGEVASAIAELNQLGWKGDEGEVGPRCADLLTRLFAALKEAERRATP